MDQKCKQTGLRAHCKGPVKMVFCLIVGCASKSTREKDLKFFQVPSLVTKQGEEAEKLLKEGVHCGFRLLVGMIQGWIQDFT